MDEAHLADVPLFAPLSRRERLHVARMTDEIDLDAGKQLATEGEYGYEFFVLEEGTAEVCRGGEHLADLGPGDFFGEISAMDNGRRRASVVATSPVKAIVMTAHDLRVLANELPAVEARIREAIALRTKRLN
jgi:CRP-like cAMP-binding protein